MLCSILLQEKNTRFFYKINNGNWHFADENSRKLDFPSLSAGDYQITLKTEDKNASPIVLNFTIKQVFWKSWIFILFVGGFCRFFSSIFIIDIKSEK